MVTFRAQTFILVCVSAAACGRRGDDRADHEAQRGDSLAIVGVTVIDVAARDAAGAAQAGRTVLIAGSRIAAVGPDAALRVPGGVRTVEGRGKYLIPGLWDAHAHITYAGQGALSLYLANGVTTVRDLGGVLAELAGWRRRIRDGSLVGPRLLLAGPNLEGAIS